MPAMQSRKMKRVVLPTALLTASALTTTLVVAAPVHAQPSALTKPTVAGESVPDVRWRDCPPVEETGPGTFDCARVIVPLDYDHPRGRTIGIALKRHLATNPGRRIGSLFINPGGPGVSGVDIVAFAEFLFSPRVLARFDVIGFDPRGVGHSAPLTCFRTPDEGYDLLGGLPPFPVTWHEDRSYARAFAGFTRQCERRGGPIMKHMSTGNVARDLDRLRAAVGDTKLTFAGFSYGSMIGATYANLFPGRVRAILIDGIHDPVLWTTGRTALQGSHVPMTTRLGSHRSASATLQRLFRLCRQAGPADCALARGGDPKDRFDQAARQLRREPLELELDGASDLLTYAQFISTTLNTLRDPFSWQEFSAFADDIATQAGFRAVSRSYQRLHASLGLDEGYGSDRQSIEGFPGALCADSTNPSGWPAWSLAGRWADAQARYFGRPWTWNSIACATWPARDRDRYTGPWSARTAHPVLVVGNRFDPATPYVNARAMARLLPRARLLTLNGQGHVASGLSSCIDAAESAYLLRGALPPRGTVCDPDFEPFGPVPSLRSSEQRQQHDARRQLIGATGALT